MFEGSFPPTSNRADWTVSFGLTDSVSGEPFDLTSVTEINIEVRDRDNKQSMLAGSLSDGTVLLTNGEDFTFTVTIATPAVFSKTAHGLTVDDIFSPKSTTGSLPTGLTIDEIYYVIADGLTADAFQVSEEIGGSAVNTSGSQSGTHTGQTGAVGTMQWTFPASEMRALCAKTYDVGGTMTDANGAVTQFILGSLPVFDGIMT